MSVVRVLIFLCAFPVVTQDRTADAADTIAVKAGRLLNGTTAAPVENAVIVIVGDRIDIVGPAASVTIPQGARIIDLSADTVLPGLINGHDHPAQRAFTGHERDLEGPNSLLQQFAQKGEPLPIQTARGVRNLRADLMGGVTTEYVTGAMEFLDVHLRKMINTGVIPGPRLYPTGSWLIPTAGYAPVAQVNGPWAIRSFIRQNVEGGAHHIKVMIVRAMASGPSFGRPFGDGATNFTKEEIEAATDEAHRLGVKVTAHAGDSVSIKLALNAGVDSIQHASTLTPEILDLFQKRHAGIVNTYVTGFQGYFTPKDFLYLDAEANTAEEWLAYARGILDRVIAANPRSNAGITMQDRMKERYAELKAAKARGIPLAVGTDGMHGLLNLELEYLVMAGFSPIEAISVGTGTGAKALGIDSEVGTIEKGKYADIISVKGKPDQNIRDLEKVNFIMVGGQMYGGLSFR